MDDDNAATASQARTSRQQRPRAPRKLRNGCPRCRTKGVKSNGPKQGCPNCLQNASQQVDSKDNPDSLSPPITSLQPNHFDLPLRDLQLFHDFLTASWPHLPLEADAAWQQEIPLMAHQHPFLMHGILSLGAAHLHARTNLDYKARAERHRLLAMHGLNNVSYAMTTSNPATAGQLTALLAVSYLLLFTSAYMSDPFSRFLVLVRACFSLTKQINRRGLSSPLLPQGERPFPLAAHDGLILRLRCMRQLREQDITHALASLQRVESECDLHPVHQGFLAAMRIGFSFSQLSPSDASSHSRNVDSPTAGCNARVNAYSTMMSMSADDFAIFTDDDNIASVALQAHYVAIEALLRPLVRAELNKQSPLEQREGLVILPPLVLEGAEHGVLRELLRWPMSVLGMRENTEQVI